MTIKELIEKLRKEYGAENGCYRVLQYYIENIDNDEYCYANAYGFIFGLRATNYINDDELTILHNELSDNKWKQRA